MMKRTKNDSKKLLFLGSNAGSKEMIEYARSKGVKTIVVDYLPPEKSFAKSLSDENHLISTNDLSGLTELIQEEQITGVLAGISEFNILQAIRLSKNNNLIFWCDEEQWNIVEDKASFRNLCEEYRIPVPKTYHAGGRTTNAIRKNFRYPLVLKPVDSSASLGVYICNDESEFLEKEKLSLEASKKGAIIVEEFIDGVEFTAHYVVKDAVCRLACIDNRYPQSVREGNVTTLPIARVYPALFIDDYLKTINQLLEQMFSGIGLTNSVVFVQGLFNQSTGKFYIFEAGLRPAGEYPARFIKKVNGLDFTKLLVENALKSSVDGYDIEKEDPYLKGNCCSILSYISPGGKINDIIGIEKALSEVNSVVDYELRYKPGDIIPETNTLRQIILRFVIVSKSREELSKDIKKLNDLIDIKDEFGDSLILKFNPDRVYDIY